MAAFFFQTQGDPFADVAGEDQRDVDLTASLIEAQCEPSFAGVSKRYGYGRVGCRNNQLWGHAAFLQTAVEVTPILQPGLGPVRQAFGLRHGFG